MEMSIISYGEENPSVGLIQNILQKTGFYLDQINYFFDEQTEEAVKAYQKAAKILSDGVVGPQTWNALMPYLTGNYSYKISDGDTVLKIAQHANITVDSLLAANPFLGEKTLFHGQKILIPFMEKIIFTNIKYSYEIMQLNIGSLKMRYPFLEIGNSGSSILGNSIPYIRIGKGEKTVFYNASHHANEWICSLLLMKFTEEFCYAYVNKTSIKNYDIEKLYEQASIYIMPMVNPDGVNLVTGALNKLSKAYIYAKSISRENIPFPSGWKANIAGVDLNLNYPAKWQEAKKIKYAQGYTSPSPRDYVGPYPFSEPESVAVAQFTINYNPELILAYHTQGELIYWKFLDYNPPTAYQTALKFGELSGYSVEETPYESGFAGYKDWYIQQYNRPGYTIEAGKGVSPLPISQFDKIYDDNIGILLEGAMSRI